MPVTSVLIPAVDQSGAVKVSFDGSQIMREVKLGRRPPRPGKFALALSRYLFRSRLLQSPPPSLVDWYTRAGASLSRMYLNDQYGCCVVSGKYHSEGVASANDLGAAVLGTDQEVLQVYRIWNPGNQDNGCVITDVLDYWRDKGLPFSGVTKSIAGYVSIDWTNKLEVQVALAVFGTISIGINLPADWANGATPGGVWDVTNSAIVGGHDVSCVGYNDQGVQISTWGMVITITWAAFLQKTWVEEAYAVLAKDWYAKGNLAPNGIDAVALAADLQQLGNGQIPDPNPTPVPPAPPVPVPPSPPVPVPPPPVPVVIPPFAVTLKGNFPTGVFGRTVPVTITGTASPQPVTHAQIEDLVTAAFYHPSVMAALDDPAVAAKRTASGALPPGLFVKIIAAVVPVVIADITAGKATSQIIADVVAAILAVLAGG